MDDTRPPPVFLAGVCCVVNGRPSLKIFIEWQLAANMYALASVEIDLSAYKSIPIHVRKWSLSV